MSTESSDNPPPSKVAAAAALARRANSLIENGEFSGMDAAGELAALLEKNPSIEEIDAFLAEVREDVREWCIAMMTDMRDEVQPKKYRWHQFQLPAINTSKRWREAHPSLVAESLSLLKKSS